MNDVTNEIEKIEGKITEAANDAGINKSSVDKAVKDAKSFIDLAQEKISEALDSAVDAVKEHPKAAAGIAAGAAAVVAASAYGATKLKNGETKAKPTSPKKKA